MSEFVIECWYDIDDGWIAGEYREEIVRCRDCTHNKKGACEHWDYCDIDSNINGFCAWGERRSE